MRKRLKVALLMSMIVVVGTAVMWIAFRWHQNNPRSEEVNIVDASETMRKTSDISEMISNTAAVFCGDGRSPIKYGDEICNLIIALTNRQEQLMFVRRYAEVLQALQIDKGGCSDRMRSLECILRMTAHFNRCMGVICIDSEIRIDLYLAIFARCADAIEDFKMTPPENLRDRNERPPTPVYRPTPVTERYKARILGWLADQLYQNVRIFIKWSCPDILEKAPPGERARLAAKINKALDELNMEKTTGKAIETRFR